MTNSSSSILKKWWMLSLSFVCFNATCMNYEAFDNSKTIDDFTQAVLDGDVTACDNFIKKNKKTYFNVLELCAKHDRVALFDYAASKINFSKPSVPPEVAQHWKKQNAILYKKVCGVFPTTLTLFNEESDDIHSFSTFCKYCLMSCCFIPLCLADLINECDVHYSVPMSPEIRSIYDDYQQKYQTYKVIKQWSKELMQKAAKHDERKFLKAFTVYRAQKKLEWAKETFK